MVNSAEVGYQTNSRGDKDGNNWRGNEDMGNSQPFDGSPSNMSM